MKPRFLVIGSNSFSGAHFVRYLLDLGHYVLGVSRSDEPHTVFLPYRWLEGNQQEHFQFQRIDLNYDLDRLIDLITKHRPEYIVNFSAQSMVAESWQTPEHWYQTNVIAQVKLHDQLRKLDFLKKYVHVSTPDAYGSTEDWVTEHYRVAPSTPYAVSRVACDLHLMSFYKAYGFPVVFTRSATIYGPGQPLYCIVPRSLFFARTGRRLQLFGSGHSVRSFIHIDDVADATYRIALHGAAGTTYHISTRSTVSIRELVERICAMMGMAFGEWVDVIEDRLGNDQAYRLDSTRLRKELCWKDWVGLDQGLCGTLQWIDQNLVTLARLPTDYQHKP